MSSGRDMERTMGCCVRCAAIQCSTFVRHAGMAFFGCAWGEVAPDALTTSCKDASFEVVALGGCPKASIATKEQASITMLMLARIHQGFILPASKDAARDIDLTFALLNIVWPHHFHFQIGRASCRERVELWVVDVRW